MVGWDGYTIPRVKVFEYHKDGEKIPEIVHAQYQSLTREFARSVQELIVEHNILPGDILAVFLVLGGDHGQDAFRLCFRALLNTKGRVMPYYKTKSIELVVRTDCGEVVCDWRAKAEFLGPTATAEDTAGEVILPDTLRMLTADLSFDAYALGKEGGSGHYCPYCRMTKTQWVQCLELQPVPEMWTLEPIGLGIDNDIVAAFEDRAEARVVKVPPADHAMREQLADLDKVIEDSREAVRVFDLSPDGSSCLKLAQQQRDSGKTMTEDELALLASLDALRTALTFARKMAKQAKNIDAIKEAKDALDTPQRRLRSTGCCL